ncbi:TPA: Dot/Icm T4SS effector Ceg3, partial [Legionella pneumophila]|nr:Dot/Icm T4SS effector Ceg3 [Legionella pneumophila]
MNRLKFFSKFHNALLKFESSISNLSDPLVGFKIKELQTKKILVRADGRSLDHLHKLGGLPQRVDSEKLEKVRITDV